MTVKMKQLLKSYSGFSLVEMLASLLVITLLFTVVATGVPVAQRVYNQVVAGSNAQLLLSTSAMRLRAELGLGRMEDPAFSGTISSYISGSTGLPTALEPDSGKTGIEIVSTVDAEHGTTTTDNLLNEDMPDRLYVSFDRIDYADGVFIVKGLCARQKKGDSFDKDHDQTLAEIDELEIRSLPTT